MSDFKPIVFISESAGMKAEIAKSNQAARLESTNLKATPIIEQIVHKMPYGADGMQLSKMEVYNPFATILPNAEAEQARNNLKQEERKKKKKRKKPEAKKKNFWEWLFDLPEGSTPPLETQI
ncbi:MAG: hypothetical protein H7263_15600 [Candidatus Sericytochromatia bacterium]|nr:hypothetical protein [Candidatus Sericytochromatia bacterium]